MQCKMWRIQLDIELVQTDNIYFTRVMKWEIKSQTAWDNVKIVLLNSGNSESKNEEAERKIKLD